MERITVSDKKELGRLSAKAFADAVNSVIEKKGKATVLTSYGHSLLPFFENLADEKIKWEKVEVFGFYEYSGMPVNHPASVTFQLMRTFVERIRPGTFHLINGQDSPEKTVSKFTTLIGDKKIDLFITDVAETSHAISDAEGYYGVKRLTTVSKLSSGIPTAVSASFSLVKNCDKIIAVTDREEVNGGKEAEEFSSFLRLHGNVTVYCDIYSLDCFSEENNK